MNSPIPNLQPCPICAGPANLEYYYTEHHPLYGQREWHRVACSGLVLSSGRCCATPYKVSAEVAIKIWNRRDLESSHFNGMTMFLISIEQDSKASQRALISAISDQTRDLIALRGRLQTYQRALVKIAAFEEGPNVTASFDEPSAARIAREALK